MRSLLELNTNDPYLAVRQVTRLQLQAGVDPQIVALVRAYARVTLDDGEPLDLSRDALRAASQIRTRDALLDVSPDLDPRLIELIAAYAERMRARGLAAIASTVDLCAQLQCSDRQLDWVLGHKERLYCSTTIPKRSGRARAIDSPRGVIRRAQQWIKRNALDAAPIGRAAHGYVKKRSIATNAEAHVGKEVVVSLDLEGFFPSIDFKRTRRAFELLGYPYPVAVKLADICTYRGTLPQGTCTSPAISNLACRNLDRRLSGLGSANHFTYTRYADDLTFSSNDKRLPGLLPFIASVVEDEAFACIRRRRAYATRINDSRSRAWSSTTSRASGVPIDVV